MSLSLSLAGPAPEVRVWDRREAGKSRKSGAMLSRGWDSTMGLVHLTCGSGNNGWAGVAWPAAWHISVSLPRSQLPELSSLTLSLLGPSYPLDPGQHIPSC